MEIQQEQLLTMTDDELTRRMGELEGDLKPGDTPASEAAPPKADTADLPPASPAPAGPGTTDALAPPKGDIANAPAAPAAPAIPGASSPVPVEIPEPIKALIPAQYKGNLEEFRKGFDELTAFLARQGQEVGTLRHRLKAFEAKPAAAAVPPPNPAPDAGADPTTITDDQIKTALYEEMDPNKAFALWTQRQRQIDSKVTAAKTEEDALQAQYMEDVQKAYEGLCKDIPGFGDTDGRVRNELIAFGRTHGLLASDELEFQRDLQRLDADPVNGPRVVRAIAAQMAKAKELETLKAEWDRRLKDLEARGKVIADDVAGNLNRAARAPVVIGAGAGSGGGTEGGVPVLTKEQILTLPEDKLNEYLAAVEA